MLEWLRSHWALAGASVLVLALLLRAAWHVYSRSPRARLARARRVLREAEVAAARQQRHAARARRRCEKLEGRAQSVRPVRLEEARGRLTDAESLLKIASDQVLIAENRLRKVIVEHFPPARHDQLRARYLPRRDDKRYPFKFS